MQYRHETKIAINMSDAIAIRQRMRAIAQIDPHAEPEPIDPHAEVTRGAQSGQHAEVTRGAQPSSHAQPSPHAQSGSYLIRSLYFDTPTDRALREKIDSVNKREKYRIRMYNNDTSFIQLEKKSKINGLGTKCKAKLSAQEVERILCGEVDWMLNSDRPLVQELYAKWQGQLLRPKTIVQYRREPFVYAPGNVRVTIDSDLRTGIYSLDFLNPDCSLVPVGDTPAVLEVKWDNFLPGIIKDAVQLGGRRGAAFSKYAASRIYG